MQKGGKTQFAFGALFCLLLFLFSLAFGFFLCWRAATEEEEEAASIIHFNLPALPAVSVCMCVSVCVCKFGWLACVVVRFAVCLRLPQLQSEHYSRVSLTTIDPAPRTLDTLIRILYKSSKTTAFQFSILFN